jgi:hypothetical protein
MGVSVSDGRCLFEFEASDDYAGPGDARVRSLEEERVVTVTITGTGRALLAKAFPGHIEVLNQLVFEPLSRQDAQAVADLLASWAITWARPRPPDRPWYVAVGGRDPFSWGGRG